MSAFDPATADRARHRRRTGSHCARRQIHIIWVYGLVSLVLIAVYPLLPPLGRTIDFLLVSLGTLPPAVWVLRRRSPGRRRPWWFLLIALVVLNVGNLAWYWYTDVLGRPTADGTVSDLLISVGHVLMLASVISIVIRRGRNDVGGLIDTVIVSMAAGGLLWDVVILPHMDATHETVAAKLSMFFDVFVLAAILGAISRLLLTAREVIHALWLLMATLVLSFTGNVLVSLLLDPDTGARPDWTNMIFMAAYTCLGLVALARSSVLLTRPGPTPADDFTHGRLAFLAVALAAIPVVGGGRQIFGYPVDGMLLALGGAAVTSLVMVRIGRLAAQRTRAERALLHQATHDALTGLPNRREFVAQLSAELARAPRLGPVVLFCDLDGFKAVNDRFGHVAGDMLLSEVAGRLRRCVREEDIVSRFGGDEFLVLCRDASPADTADLCRRIASTLADPVIIDGEAVRIGASIGVVTAGHTSDAEELIHRADALMYTAKQQRPVEVPGVRTVAA